MESNACVLLVPAAPSVLAVQILVFSMTFRQASACIALPAHSLTHSCSCVFINPTWKGEGLKW